MKHPRQKTILRLVHLVSGMTLAAYVYIPPQLDVLTAPLRLALAYVGVPLVSLTGVWMWKGTAVKRSLRALRATSRI